MQGFDSRRLHLENRLQQLAGAFFLLYGPAVITYVTVPLGGMPKQVASSYAVAFWSVGQSVSPG